MDTWTWKPRGTTKPHNTALNTRVEFINNNEQVQQNSVYNKLIYEATFEDQLSEIVKMRNFFYAHCHGEVFYFVNEYGENMTVRFAADQFEPELQWGWGDNGKLAAQGGKVTLSFRRVVQ